MAGIFEALWDLQKLGIELSNYFFASLSFAFSVITKGFAFLASLVNMLPTEMIAGSIALLIIAVVYKILGREVQS